MKNILVFIGCLLCLASYVPSIAQNKVSNPGFESGVRTPWTGSGNVSNVNRQYSGLYSGYIGTAQNLEQVVGGLTVGTTYQVKAWVWPRGTGANVQLGVKNYGTGSTPVEVSQATTAAYVQKTFQFTANSTSATIYYKRSDTGSSWCHIDDVEMIASTSNTLTVSPTSLNFTSAAGSQNLSITSNVSWTVSDNQTWLTLSAASGSNNASVTVSATANTGTTQRTGTITVTGGGITRTVSVTQAAASSNTLTVSPTSLSFASAAGSQSVSVSSNVSWTASDDRTWLTISPASGSNNGSITVTSTANTGTTARTGTLTVTGGGITQTVSITQAGTSPPSSGRVKVGSNFWVMSWGGASADPFATGYANAIDASRINDYTYNPFKPVFMDEIAIYNHLRFMDYTTTNSSTEKIWSNRIAKSAANQRTMAWEWVIEMSNFANKDAWICIPHLTVDRTGALKGTNSYIKKLAILFKHGVDMGSVNLDNVTGLSTKTKAQLIALGGVERCRALNSNLNVYIEYSNETWNSTLGTQVDHARAEGTALGLPGGNQYWDGYLFHAWAAIRTFEEWESVWGQDNSRVIKVDAFQMGTPSQVRRHIEDIYDSSSYNPNGTYPDAFSPAFYVGKNEDGASNTLKEDMLAHLRNERLPQLREAFGYMKQGAVSHNRNYEMIAYEGGQHIKTNADIASSNPDMYDVYITLLDSVSNYMPVFTHYVHTGAWGSNNAWGAKERIGDPVSISSTPKMKALIDWINGTASLQAPLEVAELLTSEPKIISKSDAFQTYPNPVKDVFNLAFNNAHQGEVSIVVFDLNGRMIHQLKDQKAAGAYNKTFQLGHLKSGLYVVEITAGDKREVLRIVKE